MPLFNNVLWEQTQQAQINVVQNAYNPAFIIDYMPQQVTTTHWYIPHSNGEWSYSELKRPLSSILKAMANGELVSKKEFEEILKMEV